MTSRTTDFNQIPLFTSFKFTHVAVHVFSADSLSLRHQHGLLSTSSHYTVIPGRPSGRATRHRQLRVLASCRDCLTADGTASCSHSSLSNIPFPHTSWLFTPCHFLTGRFFLCILFHCVLLYFSALSFVLRATSSLSLLYIYLSLQGFSIVSFTARFLLNNKVQVLRHSKLCCAQLLSNRNSTMPNCSCFTNTASWSVLH